MRERILRYVVATGTALLTNWIGLQKIAEAEARTCSLNDVAAWQVSIASPEEEGTPAYIRKLTEDFIAACPDRPEISEAHRIAAMAAGWARDPEGAAAHFELAGYQTDAETLFMHASALIAVGQPERAWKLRDEAIEYWLSGIIRRSRGEVAIEQIAGGEIIHVRFRNTAAENRQTHVWIAKPDGEGWPASLNVSSEAQFNAFHRLSAGEDAGDLHLVRLHRCNTRRLLARMPGTLDEAGLADAARLALKAYLAKPDVPKDGDFETCVFSQRILPDVSSAPPFAIQ